jgi:creatinine amidohydrolase
MDIASAIVERVATNSSRHLVVAPVLPGGVSTAHLFFPGTVTLPTSVIEGYLDAYIDLFEGMALTAVAVFSAHGGNFPFIHEVVPELQDRHSSVVIAGYAESERFFDLLLRTAQESGMTTTPTDIHAGGIETSMALALFPERCRSDEVGEGGYSESVEFSTFVPIMYEQGIQALSPIGVLGDPRLASADVGQRLVEAWVGELVRWIDEALPAVKTQ